MQRTYLAIDLKSYYASAECATRHLDPLTTNLIVADSSRTEKTICLAVSPSLKAYGIPGRARLFEVVQKVKEINANRLREAVQLRKAVYKNGKPSFSSASYDSLSLAADPSLELSYLVAPPRMAYYEKVSRQMYGIYLKSQPIFCVFSDGPSSPLPRPAHRSIRTDRTFRRCKSLPGYRPELSGGLPLLL